MKNRELFQPNYFCSERYYVDRNYDYIMLWCNLYPHFYIENIIRLQLCSLQKRICDFSLVI